MSYCLDVSNDSCYPDTTILINKLNIKNQDVLNKMEKALVSLHMTEIINSITAEPFTFDFYCSLHKKLFEDIYSWAGEIRKVNISKKGTNFCSFDKIQKLGMAKFNYLQRKNEFKNLNSEDYIREISDLYNELNILHPFREGNGRTQKVFFSLLIKRNGYNIDFAKCDADYLMIATIYAAHGVKDYLQNFFASEIDFGYSIKKEYALENFKSNEETDEDDEEENEESDDLER